MRPLRKENHVNVKSKYLKAKATIKKNVPGIVACFSVGVSVGLVVVNQRLKSEFNAQTEAMDRYFSKAQVHLREEDIAGFKSGDFDSMLMVNPYEDFDLRIQKVDRTED
jgi:hypothetical protein